MAGVRAAKSLSLYTPKIADFGLAKQLDSAVQQTESGAIMGTPTYMAPEQASGKHQDVGPPTDVYALGAILYELLTGRPPFKAATPLDTVLQVVSEEPVAPSRLQPKLSRDLEIICLKCLQKDPRKRYASAAALGDDLRRFMADEPILARPVGFWERAAKWARRRPAVAALIGVSLVALLALATLGLAYQARLQSANSRLAAALADAEVQRDQALAAKAKADREHDRAQAHLHKALEAVDHMLTQVGDERLVRLPQFADLRRRLLEEALEFHRGFLRQETEDPEVRRETGRADFRMAGLYLMLGQSDKSESTCQEAVKLEERLVADFPDQPEYGHDLSKSYGYLGHVYSVTGRFELALTAYRKAFDTCAKLVRENPTNRDYQETQANNVSNLGYYYSFTAPNQAEEYFRQAVGLAEGLVQTHPERPTYQYLLAGSLGNLGMVLFNRNRLPEAEQALDRGAKLLPTALTASLQAANYHLPVLPLNQVYHGLVYARTGRFKQAESSLRQGIAGLEEFLVSYPNHFPYRVHLINSYPALADLYERSKQSAPAAETWKKSAELAERLTRDYPTFFWLAGIEDRIRARQMLSQIQQGDVPAALAQAETMRGKKDLAGDTAYNLACVYALASTKVDSQKSEEYLQRSLELLRRSENGYLNTLPAVKHAREDDDLKPLRGRKEFQERLDQAEKKASSTREAAGK